MAIYHLAVKSVSRSTGRSAVAAVAYRAGVALENERDGLVHDYTRRSGVEDAFIVVPEGAEWAQDRSALWNAAEAAEKRKDAKVAREYELGLPAELDAGQRRDLVRAFAEDIRDRYGVAVDAAIHAPHDYGDDRNHHAHVMTTTRVRSEEHTSELQSLMRNSYAVFCLKKKKHTDNKRKINNHTSTLT